VLINGDVSPFFYFKRGLCQGFPLSSLIFLFVVEGLSKAIAQAAYSGDFGGILISHNLRLTHLLFVDDILIFCNGSHRDAEKLKEILDLFLKATGMQINKRKSTISMYSMRNEDTNLYKSLFSFEVQDFDDGIKYLGFYLKPNYYKKIQLALVDCKVEKMLEMLELPLVVSGWSFDTR
jgi:hypothetical protein